MANSMVAKIALSFFLLLNVVDILHSAVLPYKERVTGTRLGNEQPEEEEDIEKIPHFSPIDIPSPFRSYDLNKDGFVTLQELAKVTETTIKDARGAFRSADSNNDNKMSYKEFSRAPWIFRADDAIDEDMSSFIESDLQ